jgi:hypothetical protein
VNRGLQASLLVSVLVTLLLFEVPYGDVIGWPLVLLSTLAHELGHGLSAVLVGGRFVSLEIYADASGLSTIRAPAGWREAVVAAGGLVGPAIGATCCFLAGRSARGARTALDVGAVLLLFVDAIWVRNIFGFGFVLVLAGSMALARRRLGSQLPRVVVAFLGVQLSLSVFSRSDYLFTPVARTGAGAMASDVAQMSAVLGGPYWVWGAVCGLFSLVVLAIGLSSALRTGKG